MPGGAGVTGLEAGVSLQEFPSITLDESLTSQEGAPGLMGTIWPWSFYHLFPLPNFFHSPRTWTKYMVSGAVLGCCRRMGSSCRGPGGMGRAQPEEPACPGLQECSQGSEAGVRGRSSSLADPCSHSLPMSWLIGALGTLKSHRPVLHAGCGEQAIPPEPAPCLVPWGCEDQEAGDPTWKGTGMPRVLGEPPKHSPWEQNGDIHRHTPP